MEVIIASNNQNKIREFKKIFEGSNFELKSLKEIGLDIDVEENGQTFEENAIIKATTIAKKMNMYAIADDSGLCCDGLNGEPGVYSARYAGDQHNDDDNNKKLMEKMKGVENKRARYMCAICFSNPKGEYVTTVDSCEGLIVDTPKGYNGFGYDPYFYIEKFGRTMAEITLEEKNTISHRSKALEKMKKEYAKVVNC